VTTQNDTQRALISLHIVLLAAAAAAAMTTTTHSAAQMMRLSGDDRALFNDNRRPLTDTGTKYSKLNSCDDVTNNLCQLCDSLVRRRAIIDTTKHRPQDIFSIQQTDMLILFSRKQA